MEPEQVSNPQTNATNTAEQQLADIKSQAAKIVQQAQKVSPNISISEADAEMIGLPRLNVPTQGRQTLIPGELSRVGSTTIPKTGTDKAREALLSQVPEEDQATISAILDASMGLQTERGAQLESDLDNLSSERLRLAQDKKDRVLDRKELENEFDTFSMQAELETISEEADALSAKRNIAIQAEASREGVSSNASNANIAAIEKDFNLQRANLAIRELAAVRKINAATRAIEAKLDIKYGDIEAETELVKAQIESILPLLSREDAKVAEQRLMLNQIAQNTIADAREADKVLEEFKLQSYMNAQANGATPALLSMIMSSDNREDILSVGGSFVEDPMLKLQRRQAEASISASLTSADASRLSQRSSLLELAFNGDLDSIAQLGYDPRQTGLSADEVKQTEADIQEADVSLNVIDNLLNNKRGIGAISGQIKSPGISGFFQGPSNQGVKTPITRFTPIIGNIQGALESRNARDNALTDLTYIYNTEGFQTFIGLKESGLTFGSLTEGERAAIFAAANRLNSGVQIDSETGRVTGYRGTDTRLREDLALVGQGLEAYQEEKLSKLILTSSERDEIANIK